MSHDHEHDHGHHHGHGEAAALTDLEKLARLLPHWVEHNNEHAAGYLKWAALAQAEGKTRAAELLRQAARATDEISELFNQAAQAV